MASKRELTPSSEGAQTMLSSCRSPAGSGGSLGAGSGHLSDGEESQYLGTAEEVGGAGQGKEEGRGEMSGLLQESAGEEKGQSDVRPSLVVLSDRESLTPSPPPPDMGQAVWGEDFFPAGLGCVTGRYLGGAV